MKNTMKRALVCVVTSALCIAATAPVAMRVEVEPLRQVGPLTEVAVVIQIAPMDRGRMGSNAIVRLELDEGRVSSGSPMRAAAIEDDGSIRLLVEWPPGEHDLRVFVEDPSKEDTGLWVGKVRIPDLGPGDAMRDVDEQTPASESASASAPEPQQPLSAPAPVPVPDPDISEVPEPTIERDPEPILDAPPSDTTVITDEAVAAGSAAAAGATIASEPPTPPIPSDVQVPKSESPMEVSVPEPVAVDYEEAPSTIDTIPELEAAPEPDPEPVVAPAEAIAPSVEQTPEPEATAAVEPEPVETEEPAATEAPPPLVEPLRSDPPAEPSVPEATTVEPTLEAPAMSADLLSLYTKWGEADPSTLEFTVILLRGRDPALNVEASDLRVRVGGKDTPVDRLGGPGNAPLLLGLAVDVSPEEIEAWSGMQGSLAPIVDRAKAGRGRLFISNQQVVGDWDTDPESVVQTVGPADAMNVAELVVASLERFEGQRGRTFLVVLTDGRNEPSKDDWRRATDVAGVSGVPILVISLWDAKFSQRTRKNLKNLAVASGGSLFLVQGRAQLQSAADRFGRYLDGGYSIRFRIPAATAGAALPLSVTADDRSIDVSAPKSIR